MRTSRLDLLRDLGEFGHISDVKGLEGTANAVPVPMEGLTKIVHSPSSHERPMLLEEMEGGDGFQQIEIRPPPPSNSNKGRALLRGKGGQKPVKVLDRRRILDYILLVIRLKRWHCDSLLAPMVKWIGMQRGPRNAYVSCWLKVL